MTNSKNMSNRHRDERKFSPNFLVYISSSKYKTTVVSRAPEDLTMQINADWDTPLAQSGASGIVEVGVQELLNRSTKTQFASAQIWSGSTPIEITLQLEFQAEQDPKQEVIQPIISLGKMALPSLSGEGGSKGLFSPPGPRIFNFGGGDNIIIQLGEFLIFESVIITNVNPVFKTRDMGVSGVPIRATCDVTFRTAFSLTGNEFENMFFK